MTRFQSRFLVGLAWRLALVLLACFIFAQALSADNLGAARIVAGLGVVGTAIMLWRHVRRTNVELARFVDAVRFADFSQGFSHRFEGSGFGELGEVLDQALKRMRDEKHRLTDTNRFYEAVLDDAATALLIVEPDGKIELANKAARRLLFRHQGVRIEDFLEYGDAFARALESGAAKRPRLVPLVSDGIPQTVLVSTAIVHRLGGLVRVVAVQPIQSELNAIEIAAQSDLIRVLTHEIMNSMTPVTSLAHSAVQLMRGLDGKDNRDIADARAAVETLSRRADGVMKFVESYRQISRAPEIRPRAIDIAAWATELESIFRASETDVAFTLRIDSKLPALQADPDLMSQVLINLLRNGAEAARGHSDAPAVSLGFDGLNDGRTRITVEDNGPGVPDQIRQDIFLPFFTTKAKGTGVGLSLARQVVLAHRGSISVDRGPAGGARFRTLI